MRLNITGSQYHIGKCDTARSGRVACHPQRTIKCPFKFSVYYVLRVKTGEIHQAHEGAEMHDIRGDANDQKENTLMLSCIFSIQHVCFTIKYNIHVKNKHLLFLTFSRCS